MQSYLYISAIRFQVVSYFLSISANILLVTFRGYTFGFLIYSEIFVK